MFTFNNFQFIPNCQKLWHWKNQFFLLFHTACISLAWPLSLLPFTRDTHMVCLQLNVSYDNVQLWIFNISNTYSFTQTIYIRYKYYSKWICVSFPFQYSYKCIRKHMRQFLNTLMLRSGLFIFQFLDRPCPCLSWIGFMRLKPKSLCHGGPSIREEYNL